MACVSPSLLCYCIFTSKMVFLLNGGLCQISLLCYCIFPSNMVFLLTGGLCKPFSVVLLYLHLQNGVPSKWWLVSDFSVVLLYLHLEHGVPSKRWLVSDSSLLCYCIFTSNMVFLLNGGLCQTLLCCVTVSFPPTWCSF